MKLYSYCRYSSFIVNNLGNNPSCFLEISVKDKFLLLTYEDIRVYLHTFDFKSMYNLDGKKYRIGNEDNQNISLMLSIDKFWPFFDKT